MLEHPFLASTLTATLTALVPILTQSDTSIGSAFHRFTHFPFIFAVLFHACFSIARSVRDARYFRLARTLHHRADPPFHTLTGTSTWSAREVRAPVASPTTSERDIATLTPRVAHGWNHV